MEYPNATTLYLAKVSPVDKALPSAQETMCISHNAIGEIAAELLYKLTAPRQVTPQAWTDFKLHCVRKLVGVCR